MTKVYFKRYIPPRVEEETMRLAGAYFGQFTEEQMKEDMDENDFSSFIESHCSEEYKLWTKYESFTGDEGELLDKNGSFILDKAGTVIQDWTVDDNGYLLDLQGDPIFYSDGERVKNQDRNDYMPYIDDWFPMGDEEDD